MPPVSLYSLDLEYDSEDALLVSKEYRPRKSTHSFVKHPFALHSIILGIYTILFFLALTVLFTGPDHGPNLIHSPARSAVSFQRKVFDGALVIENPFTGSPRPELDEAWHRLLQNANIRVSEKTLRKVNGSSIAFADGDGYYAQLSMFHELHCLKRIRHFIHKDYYNPDQSDDARRPDHCLEVLRQGVMCRGDISLVTFVWSPKKRLPLADFSQPHECVNFDALNRWSGQHSVDVFAPGLLQHPTLGPGFPTDGEVDGV
ncbi:MAG: hypothetical protein Q9202_001988 [Teloschistes flavicans]